MSQPQVRRVLVWRVRRSVFVGGSNPNHETSLGVPDVGNTSVWGGGHWCGPTPGTKTTSCEPDRELGVGRCEGPLCGRGDFRMAVRMPRRRAAVLFSIILGATFFQVTAPPFDCIPGIIIVNTVELHFSMLQFATI